MERCTVIHVTPPNATHYMRVDPHIYPDIPGLLLLATIEGDGAVDEVGAVIMVKAKQGWSISSRCL